MCRVASKCLQEGDRLTPGGRHAPCYPKFRDNLHKQLKPTQVDTPEYLRLKTNLDNYNKVLKQSIRAAKQAHYYDIFDEHRNDINKTWTSIKKCLNQIKDMINSLTNYLSNINVF